MKLNHPTGQAAEDRALAFLQAQGCELVARNWHCAYGEIDLIMQFENKLLFIEVKFRKNGQFGGAAYSITPKKLAKLQRSAAQNIICKSIRFRQPADWTRYCCKAQTNRNGFKIFQFNQIVG